MGAQFDQIYAFSEITLFIGEQIKVNKCRTKTGKMLHNCPLYCTIHS